MVAFTYDEVVRSWHDDDGREGSSEIVWVVSNGLILSLFKLGSEFIQCVSIRAIFDGNIVHLSESGNIQGVGISLVDICVTTTDGGVALIVIVRVRQTLTSTKQATYIWLTLQRQPAVNTISLTCQVVHRQRTTNRPDAFHHVAIDSNGVSGQDSRNPWPKVVQCTKARHCLLNICDTIAWQEAVVGCGVQTRTWSSDISFPWGNELMLSRDINMLICGPGINKVTVLPPQDSDIPFSSNVGHNRVPQLLSAFETPMASRRSSCVRCCSRSLSIILGKAAAPSAPVRMSVNFIVSGTCKRTMGDLDMALVPDRRWAQPSTFIYNRDTIWIAPFRCQHASFAHVRFCSTYDR